MRNAILADSLISVIIYINNCLDIVTCLWPWSDHLFVCMCVELAAWLEISAGLHLGSNLCYMTLCNDRNSCFCIVCGCIGVLVNAENKYVHRCT
jgi:hypothetical protein